MNVTYYHGRPHDSCYSIERLFQDIRKALPDNLQYNVAVSRFKSRGFWPRVYNIFEAAFRQGDVNHITGDVHFLTYLLHKKKTILTILDCVTLERLTGIRGKVFFFLWYWLPEKRSKIITVISNSTKKELLRYLKCNPDKISVIPCCVSKEFKPTPKSFNINKPVILQICTVKNKNLLRVAEALKGIPCHLRIIGELPHEYISFLQDCAIEYSSVSNISDEQIVNEYQQCDMLVFASTYEGFGLPVLEAQKTGRAVITSDILSMPEVAGDAACLVDPFDNNNIREGILRIIQDTEYRDDLIKKGFVNIERFRPEKIAEQYIELYNELL